MPRQSRRRDEAAQPARAAGPAGERREGWRGEQYLVRPVTAAGAVKAYRCPGCDQLIRPGVPHQVAWRVSD